MNNEPTVMRSNSTGAVTKVLPEFVRVYIESGWVFVNEEAHGGVEDKMSERVTAVRQAVADAMIEHGPDGHIDGYEEITDAALAVSDAVMFSDEAVERAAIALCVKRYPMTEGFWGDVDGDFQEKCRDQSRAVIAALKGHDA